MFLFHLTAVRRASFFSVSAVDHLRGFKELFMASWYFIYTLGVWEHISLIVCILV